MPRALFTEGGPGGYSGSINRKAGGVTFSKNNLVRARNGSPNQPNTAEQARVKAATTAISTFWGTGLSPAQRITWNDAAKSGDWDFNDPLTGTTRRLNGAVLFMALNSNLAFLNQDSAVVLQASVPVKAILGDTYITSIVADASAGTIALAYSGTLGGDEEHVVSFSAPISPGRMAFRASKLSFLAADGAVSPLALGAAYVAKYGAITALTGWNIYYEVIAIDAMTGQKRLAGRGVVQIIA